MKELMGNLYGVGPRIARERRTRHTDRHRRLMLEGVVAARNRRYLMLNAAETDLPAIRAILPGMGAPSVLPLAEPGQIAVHAAVEVDDIWELLPLLKGAGASSILVVPVERLVP